MTPHYNSLSRLLAKVLRHDAVKMGLVVGADGYVNIYDLLETRPFKDYTLDDIFGLVVTNNTQRFQVTNDINDESILYIRALHGHTIASIDHSLLLEDTPDPT
jgi:2'-phosphotransferase